MQGCKTCIFAVNPKNSESNTAWQCHYNPPGPGEDGGWAKINCNDPGCSCHIDGASEKEPSIDEKLHLANPTFGDLVAEAKAKPAAPKVEVKVKAKKDN